MAERSDFLHRPHRPVLLSAHVALPFASESRPEYHQTYQYGHQAKNQRDGKDAQEGRIASRTREL